MQVTFYEGGSAGHVVPRLIEKMYQQKQRGVVWVPDATMFQALHDVLWTFSKTVFIPHGGKADGINPSEQPFWFTHTLENPNQATALMTIGAPYTEVAEIQKLNFTRVIDVCQQATSPQREQYNAYVQAGFEAQWWLNTEQGWKAKTPAQMAA